MKKARTERARETNTAGQYLRRLKHAKQHKNQNHTDRNAK